MSSPGREAGLVLALSALAVAAFLAAKQAVFPAPAPQAAGAVASEPAQRDARRLAFPVRGFERALRDNFDEMRGLRRHGALDIMAPRGTPVVAVDDGRIAKLFRNPLGGITLYQFDPGESRVYYYAHLDSYARGLAEGMPVRRGDVVGYVGSTGNAPKSAPHLHFAVFALGSDKRWWRGSPVNPYPLLKADSE